MSQLTWTFNQLCVAPASQSNKNLDQHTEPGQWANQKMPNSGGKEHKTQILSFFRFLFNSQLYFFILFFVID